jgi:hypothetical protein
MMRYVVIFIIPYIYLVTFSLELIELDTLISAWFAFEILDVHFFRQKEPFKDDAMLFLAEQADGQSDFCGSCSSVRLANAYMFYCMELRLAL